MHKRLTSVFAIVIINIKKLSSPLQSRFFIVTLKPYTYEQFSEIANKLLSSHKIEEGIASVISNAVWRPEMRLRVQTRCVRICKLARSAEDAKFVVDTFLDTDRMIDE